MVASPKVSDGKHLDFAQIMIDGAPIAIKILSAIPVSTPPPVLSTVSPTPVIVADNDVTTKPGSVSTLSPTDTTATVVTDKVDNTKGATLLVNGGKKGATAIVNNLSNNGTVMFGAPPPADALGQATKAKPAKEHSDSESDDESDKSPFSGGIFKKNSDSNPFSGGIFKKTNDSNPFNSGIFKKTGN